LFCFCVWKGLLFEHEEGFECQAAHINLTFEHENTSVTGHDGQKGSNIFQAHLNKSIERSRTPKNRFLVLDRPVPKGFIFKKSVTELFLEVWKELEIKKVAVIGAGAMGTGIAYVCAVKGYNVSIRDVNEDLVKRGMGKIREMIATGVNRGKLTPREAEEIMKRTKSTTDVAEAVRDADLVIEAVFEDMDLKKKVFKELDEHCPPHTILASNTSVLSITEMGSATKRPDKVVGLHFFNPAYAMKLIEVISGKETSEETRKIGTDFAVSLEKEPVQVKDTPGFIVNRILGAALGEAIYLLEEGIASAKDIDRACMLGLNWPVGPIALADFVGLDVVYHSGEAVADALGEDYLRKRSKPSKLLEEKVKAGHLGVKTRKGFYEY